jgi:hypothetical protein
MTYLCFLLTAENMNVALKKVTPNKMLKLQALVLSSKTTGILNGISKNAIIKDYTEVCLEKEGYSYPVVSSNEGDPTNKHNKYPTIVQLVRNCQMKPSLDHQYQVEDLVLQNIIVILLRNTKGFLSPIEIKNLLAVNQQ